MYIFTFLCYTIHKQNPFCVSSGMDKERTCCVWQKQSLQLEDSMEAAEERLVRGWQKTGNKCYDSELLDRAAKDSGMCQEIFENHDERPTNSFLYSLVMDTYSMGYSSSAFADMPINHKVFLAQFNAIKEIAKEGPCVMVGRCADYALADNPNLVSVFVHAPLENRIRRIATKYDLTDSKAKDSILKTDKKRASYYNYYSNKKWGDAASYQLCIDSSVCGIDGSVEAILNFVALKEAAAKKK